MDIDETIFRVLIPTQSLNNVAKHFSIEVNIATAPFVFKINKRLSQQPALEALTFLRSFVAGKANFKLSHL